MDIVLAILIGVAILVIGAAIIGVANYLRLRFGWFKTEDDKDRRIARVEAQLAELQGKTAAPPEGSAPLETAYLAAQATEKTEQLLAEAIALQEENKEREAIEKLLTAYDANMPPEAKAQLHLLVGNSYLHLSDVTEAEGHYKQARELSQKCKDRKQEANATGGLGISASFRGNLEEADVYFKQALVIEREIGDRVGESTTLGNLGVVSARKGESPAARKHLEGALEIAREDRNSYAEARTLTNLGNIAFVDQDLDAARVYHEEAYALFAATGDRREGAKVLANLGNVLLRQGEIGKAEENYTQAMAIHIEFGDRYSEANQLCNLAMVRVSRNDVNEACRLLNKALVIYVEVGAGGEDLERARARLEELGCGEDA